ncbi:MAG: hypothetical protein KGI98_11955 [Euryarchaeota archaeon]|nr:hypothetical protein [Euryarchaeota archaeon]MDE1881582.1 hypothetical protein [Euryarchaeota archaeon]
MSEMCAACGAFLPHPLALCLIRINTLLSAEREAREKAEKERDEAQDRLSGMLAAYSALRAGGNPSYVSACMVNLEFAFLSATRPTEESPGRALKEAGK